VGARCAGAGNRGRAAVVAGLRGEPAVKKVVVPLVVAAVAGAVLFMATTAQPNTVAAPSARPADATTIAYATQFVAAVQTIAAATPVSSR
jgi:hypothetical protein